MRQKASSADLSAALRAARQRKALTQQELAARLGLRQRQISDLERARTDPRLSTIRDVARGLDLELRLVPRQLLAAIDALERAGTTAADQPLYRLADDEGEGAPEDAARVEAGDSRQRPPSTDRPRRRRTGSR